MLRIHVSITESAPVSPTPQDSKSVATDTPATPNTATHSSGDAKSTTAMQQASGDEMTDVQMTPGISTSLPEKEPSIWTEVRRRHKTPTSNKTSKVSSL